MLEPRIRLLPDHVGLGGNYINAQGTISEGARLSGTVYGPYTVYSPNTGGHEIIINTPDSQLTMEGQAFDPQLTCT